MNPNGMTNRERLLTILDGKPPDRLPWIPRLLIWHQAQIRRGTLPARYEGLSLREIERSLGMGTPARDGRVFRSVLHDVEVQQEQEGEDTVTHYVTPVGTVSSRQRYSEVLRQGGIATRRDMENLITGPDDYAVVEYMIEHTEIVPTYDEYLAYEAEIGEDGVPLVSIGADPMYRVMREYVGYNHVFYHLRDYPERVEHLLGVLTEQAQVIQQVALDSPARLILHGEHFDSQMTPPPIFEKYMLPYFKPFAEQMHARGKTLACHADADASLLLELIVDAGFDMAECFVTAPMVPLTMDRAREVWGKQIIIWGGIPSSILCAPYTDEAFETYMLDLLRTIAPGDAFILGVADNVMAEAYIERVERVSALLAAYGAYPVHVP